MFPLLYQERLFPITLILGGSWFLYQVQYGRRDSSEHRQNVTLLLGGTLGGRHGGRGLGVLTDTFRNAIPHHHICSHGGISE